MLHSRKLEQVSQLKKNIGRTGARLLPKVITVYPLIKRNPLTIVRGTEGCDDFKRSPCFVTSTWASG